MKDPPPLHYNGIPSMTVFTVQMLYEDFHVKEITFFFDYKNIFLNFLQLENGHKLFTPKPNVYSLTIRFIKSFKKASPFLFSYTKIVLNLQ